MLSNRRSVRAYCFSVNCEFTVFGEKSTLYIDYLEFRSNAFIKVGLFFSIFWTLAQNEVALSPFKESFWNKKPKNQLLLLNLDIPAKITLSVYPNLCIY